SSVHEDWLLSVSRPRSPRFDSHRPPPESESDHVHPVRFLYPQADGRDAAVYVQSRKRPAGCGYFRVPAIIAEAAWSGEHSFTEELGSGSVPSSWGGVAAASRKFRRRPP